LQRYFRQLPFVNINRRSVPADYPAFGITAGSSAQPEPAEGLI
jgi:hypothetical protein